MSELFPQFLVDVPQWNEGYGVFGYHQDIIHPIQHILLNVLPDEPTASLEIGLIADGLNRTSFETAGDEPTPDHEFCVIVPSIKYPLSRLVLIEFLPIEDVNSNREYKTLVRETLGVCDWSEGWACPVQDYFAKLVAEATYVGIWERK